MTVTLKALLVPRYITIHILPNISQSKGNQKMKFGQLKECKKKKYLPSEIMQKIRHKRLVLVLLLFFKKTLYEVKVSGLQVNFKIF